MNLHQLQRKATTLSNQKEVYRIGFEIMKSLEAYLVDLQQIQLSKGQNNQGLSLGTYSKATEEIAKQNSPREPKKAGDPYNFEWTGRFFDQMKLKVVLSQSEAYFISNDKKFPMLEDKYPGLMGLTQEHLTEAIKDKILPEFVKRCRSLLTT